jgi:hypothetical protein
MTSERIVDELVAGLAPIRRRSTRREWLVLGAIGAVEIGLFLLLGAARRDMALAMHLPSFWWKLGSLAVLTVVAMITAVRSFDPAASPRRGMRWVFALIALTLIIGWLIDAASAGSGALIARLMWRHGVDCVFAMLVLSLPAILALGVLMRRGAPTDRRGSALAVGAASAAWGAFVFVFNCPHDDPLYIMVWYGLGCVVVTAIARLILPLISRW